MNWKFEEEHVSRAASRKVFFFIPPVLFLILFFALSSCGRKSVSRPKLAIVIVVDQMRADYFQRFAGYFSGGLARLQKDGAVFLNAYHRHADTETAPGHATLSTGSYPAHHGIISNNWFDAGAGKSAYAVADSQVNTFDSNDGESSSPHYLMRPALGDWLKKQRASAKVVSVSRKDRSAILLGGQKPDGAYWFNYQNGGFTSSTYYFEKLPAWVAEWNGQHLAGKYRGKVWEKIRPLDEYLASSEDLFDSEEGGLQSAFPHTFSGDTTKLAEEYYHWLAETPFADELTLAFAETALRAEQLGVDDATDLLCISLSSTDAVGHGYGPQSQEMQDNLMRLDQKLGEFLAKVDQHVGLQNCVIGFSSDHGVLPLPEELRRRGYESARIPAEEVFAEVGGMLTEMSEELSTRLPLLRNYFEAFYLNYATADSLGLSHDDFDRRMAEKVKSLSFVADVFTRADLSAGENDASEVIQQFRNNFYPGRSPDLFVQYKKYYLIAARKTGTTHGSVYDYDSRVPMIFMGQGIRPGRFDEQCATVDFAPTMAGIIGLPIPGDVDGRMLDMKSPD
jgi:predicted AlkP superfamily pyrophosphatase or phosphodiesterase